MNTNAGGADIVLRCLRSKGHAVDGQQARIIQKIEPPTGPGPVSRMRNQTPFDRVMVHVSQLFISFSGAPNIQIVKAPLPNAEMSMIMDRIGQGQASQHVPAPGRLLMALQISEDKLGRTFFKAADDPGGVSFFRGPDQKMEMFGHKNVPDDSELKLDAQVIEGCDKTTAKAIRIEEARSTISAGGDKVQVVEAVIMLLARHSEMVLRKDRRHVEKHMSAPPAKPIDD